MFGNYGDGLGPGYGAIHLGTPPVPYDWTGIRRRTLHKQRGGYGADVPTAGELLQTAQIAEGATAAGSPVPEHMLDFYNEQRGVLFDDIQGRYEQGVDYAKDQYIVAMEQTMAQSQATMMAVVADAEKKLETQQRMFLIGLAIAVSVPILLLRK